MNIRWGKGERERGGSEVGGERRGESSEVRKKRVVR
jgi:hypothetical protein